MGSPTIDFSKYESQAPAPQIDFSKYESKPAQQSAPNGSAARDTRPFRERLLHPLNGNPGSFEGHPENVGEYVPATAGRAIEGAVDIGRGNVAMGTHKLIQSGMNAIAPMTPVLAAGAPVMAVRGAVGGYAGGKVLQGGASLLGASDDQAALAGDVGNLAGGFAAASGLPRALLETPVKELAVKHGQQIFDLVNNIRHPERAMKNLLNKWGSQIIDPAEAAPAPQASAAAVAKPVPQTAAPASAVPKAEPITLTPKDTTGFVKPLPGSKTPGRITLGAEGQAGDFNVAQVLQGGKPVGKLVFDVSGDRANVHWLGDEAMQNSLANQLGPMGIKQLFANFAKAHPEVKFVAGIRVGGANGEAAATKVFDISNLYGKYAGQSNLNANVRQMAGSKLEPASLNPPPSGQAPQDLTGVLQRSIDAIKAEKAKNLPEPTLEDLLMESIRLAKEGRKPPYF